MKKINWRYALGELLLIFLGITTAIWFNNWNEKQKSLETEIKSINEIKNAIQQDVQDINENISGFQNRVLLFNQLLEHIEKKLPINDSLKTNLPYLQGVTTFLPNTGPYETLKSRGLETISNDSIRLEISLYYDYEYEKIQTNERQHYEHYVNYLKPAMMLHFSLKDYKLEPLDYDNLLSDFKFEQTINWALRTDSYMLDLYKELKKISDSLLVDLSNEIERID